MATSHVKGFLISPYSAETERMAFALVTSLRRQNADIPVLVLGQDYLCGLDWRGMATVRSARAGGAHRTREKWFNKLSAMLRSPFYETIWLDCDIVPLSDPEPWFDYLGTDDFTFFQVPSRCDEVPDWDLEPEIMAHNYPNPHRIRDEYGVDSVPVIDACGHFFLRMTERGKKLAMAVVELMNGALDETEPSLYRRIAGAGNTAASDEIAASIVAVRDGIRLPEPMNPHGKFLGIYLPPWQTNPRFDLESSRATYFDVKKGSDVTPGAVHFCYSGKKDPAYLDYIAACVGRKHPSTLRKALSA